MNCKRNTFLLGIAILAMFNLQNALANSDNDNQQYAPFAPANQNVQPQDVGAYAAYPPPVPQIRNAYIGVKVGLDNTKVNYDKTAASISEEMNLGEMGFNGGLLIGVCNSYGNFYIGLEGQGDASTWESKTTVGNSSYKLKTPYTFAIDAKPGYLMSSGNTIVYGIFGLGLMQLKAEVDAPAIFNLNNFSKTVAGVRLGLGMESYLSTNVSVRGDYVYGNYSAVHSSYTADGVTYNNDFSPTTSQFSLALVFHF